VPLPGGDIGRWALDPSWTFLNHGSFGARLRETLDAQGRLREACEAQPVAFLAPEREDRLAASRERVGRFLGMAADEVGFVVNATEGVNAVLRSIAWRPGARIVALDHVYNAVRQAAREIATRSGAIYDERPLPMPVADDETVVEIVRTALDDDAAGPAQLLVIDAVTSPTALVLPVERICGLARDRGVEVLVDAAHAPGMLELDVRALGRAGATFVTGNLHKWCGAPLAAGFLWTVPERRAEVHPVAISHFLGEGVVREFGWQGTRDMTPWILAGDAIDHLGAIEGGWDAIRAHNRALVRWAQTRLGAIDGVRPVGPASMLGFMATVILPRERAAAAGGGEAILRALLAERIEVPVMDFAGEVLLRVSAQVYNRPAQYERLVEVLGRLLGPSASVQPPG